MIKKYWLICLTILFFAFSCTSDLFKQIATNDKVPDKQTVPEVKSFEQANVLVINWPKDEGAEEYILYKDLLPDGTFTKKIYEGSGLDFIDANVPQDDTFYYYKLSKKRGQKEFSKSDFSFGTSSICVNDEFEPNDTIDKAAKIDNMLQINANIYYARDGYNYVIIDADWYSVTINGGMQITYLISFNKDANYSGTGYAKNYNGIVSLYANNITMDLSDTQSFEIQNPSKSAVKCNFAILVNKTNFLSAGNTFGKRIEAYSLLLQRIWPIPTQSN